MKNTSILIPIILIGCLAALAFLFFKAMQTVEEDRPRTNRPIVLNEADYADEPTPEDIGATTDYDTREPATTNQETETTTNNATASGNNEMVEMTAAEKQAALRQDQLEDERRTREAAAREAATQEAQISSSNRGRYLVIAGSFRQRLNAEERVEALISAGFKDTRLERFNRGTFAVALAGQSNRYSEAKALAAKIVEAGFEARVMRRR